MFICGILKATAAVRDIENFAKMLIFTLQVPLVRPSVSTRQVPFSQQSENRNLTNVTAFSHALHCFIYSVLLSWALPKIDLKKLIPTFAIVSYSILSHILRGWGRGRREGAKVSLFFIHNGYHKTLPEWTTK